jgi:DNA-binding winged helix-turn-helix (wHTH) protein
VAGGNQCIIRPTRIAFPNGGIVSATHKLLRFGVFELNLDTEELHKSGKVLRLAPQPFRLLALLANHAGQVVTREQIKEQLWGEETYVDFEQGMNHCIKQIRTALADNADTPLYVETVPRRGYRFLAPVVSKNVPAPAPKIIKSQSGIQSSISPVRLPNGMQAVPKDPQAPPKLEVAVNGNRPELNGRFSGSDESPADTGVVSVYSQDGVACEDKEPPREKVTSAAAAAEALAPEIARLRRSSARASGARIWIGILLVLLIAGVLYWYLHRA